MNATYPLCHCRYPQIVIATSLKFLRQMDRRTKIGSQLESSRITFLFIINLVACNIFTLEENVKLTAVRKEITKYGEKVI